MASFRINSIACDDYSIDDSTHSEATAIRSQRVVGTRRPSAKRRATSGQGPKGRARRRKMFKMAD